MKRNLLRVVSVFIICSMLLTGCVRKTNGNENGGTDGNTGVNIVTSFYPVYIATLNVAGDIPGVSVENMTKPQTGCLHDYSLTPEDLKKLEKADIFVINGAGMEDFLDDLKKQREDLKIVEASKDIELLKDSDGEENGHVWVSVSNTITYVYNIAYQLATIDKLNADRYIENAGAYAEKLKDLKDEMHSALDNLPNRKIITFHEAFPYFAKEFNLEIAAVIESEPGTEPSSKELAGIIDMVKSSGIKALFAEPQYSSSAADLIARETEAKVYTLDPIVTGESVPGARDDYLEKMRQNMKVLLGALGA